MKKYAVIGGGASGIFAALRCAQLCQELGQKSQITVFEASSDFLKKVKISGGGRCNVTHHEFQIPEFCSHYPRGQKELRSAFHRFQALDTLDWFESRGVKLKVEDDGRMFPITNDSQTIIDCFLKEAHQKGIILKKKTNIQSIKNEGHGFVFEDKDGESHTADKVLIATGSMPQGYKLAKQCGHRITELAPSLFTFKIKHPILEDLSGTSFKNSTLLLKVMNKKFEESGALLITHWGLSGPALLKLSAWAAREMKQAGYLASLEVNWMGMSFDQTLELLNNLMKNNREAHITNRYPQSLSKRFWLSLLTFLNLESMKWKEINHKQIQKLAECLVRTKLEITGKSRFKEEFVECGGVDLKEIDIKTMQSKLCPGLYFAGEVMDVDGVTGGFNFQNAWTSGYIAGSHMPLEIT